MRIDDSELELRIGEATSWCSADVSLRQKLRSSELQPVDITTEAEWLRGMGESKIAEERARIVDQLVARRRLLLEQSSQWPAPLHRDGRVLLCEIDACFFDGVAKGVTEGFFDDGDLPPWDTWLAFRAAFGDRSSVLLSWVPHGYLGLVEKAVESHFCNAYSWMIGATGQEL
jgi:hypothetical protein